MQWHEIPGWWSEECHRYYGDVVRDSKQVAHFVEVGAWQGRSAASMATHIAHSGKLIRLDSIDTWEGSPYGDHPKILADKPKFWLRSQYEKHLRDSELWQYVNPVTGYSDKAAKSYADESVDFVFIDGDHRAEQVDADIRAWWPKLKPCGRMAGHDAQNPMVQSGIDAAGIKVEHPAPMIWEAWKKYAPVQLPDLLTVPHFDHPYWELWVRKGCEELGIGFHLSPKLGFPLRGTPKPGEPFHVAQVGLDYATIWYDYSDFIQHFSDHELMGGLPYLKVQAVPGTSPAGQFVTSAYVYCNDRVFLRKVFPGRLVAMFSNIDEVTPEQRSRGIGIPEDYRSRRRLVVRHIMSYNHPDDMAGLWKFGNRPEIPVELRAIKLPQRDYWQAIKCADAAFALPGVGGDFTRNHVEILGLGTAMITIKTDQLWPGNWRGCWFEMERDLSDLEEMIANVLRDHAERERLARLGLWYYETELAPAAHVMRLIKATYADLHRITTNKDRVGVSESASGDMQRARP